MGKCYRCGVVRHFRWDCPLRKKCQDEETRSPDFLGLVIGSEEEVGDLLVCLKESTVCAGIG